MIKLHDHHPLAFSLGWIILYVLMSTPLRAQYGDGSIQLMAGHLMLSLVIAYFLMALGLDSYYKLNQLPENPKTFIYFIPIVFLATGNLWSGLQVHYHGRHLAFALVTMGLIGFIEEVLFRGFLFRTLLKRDGPLLAISVSSVTFGLGHIVNLLSGQASLDTFIQIAFAVAWGFIFTMVYYKSSSLIPCILVHSLVDMASLFTVDKTLTTLVYPLVTIIVAILYCLHLSKLPTPPEMQE